jgi:PAS domain S-box-containing protein
MVTLGEVVRWIVYTASAIYGRIVARLLRRDKLLVGSEKRFRALLESAPDAMVIVDWHGHISLVNAQTERLFGYDREELIGQNVTELIPHRYRLGHREHQKHYMRDARTREMGSGLELYGLRKNGDEFPIEISLSPLQTDRGMLVSSAIRDVTERKRIEAELVERAAALERSNTELEQFAYVASHDLQAPLRVVAGFVGILRRRYGDQLDEEAHEYIDLAIGGVERMQLLMDDLLAYSRVRREDERELEDVDCAAAVRQVMGTLAAEIEAKDARVEVDELPHVKGDRGQVAQLFQNLIANAVKFTDGEQPLVQVTAERQDRCWRISVRDNGIGISEEHRDRVFNMFERLHTAEEFPGTGIGLAICKRIVENHGGSIVAEPAPGGGTVMAFTWPAEGRPA